MADNVDIDLDLGDPVDIDLGDIGTAQESAGIGAPLAGFDSEVGNVAPASVSIAPEPNYGSPVALADPDVDVDADLDVQTGLDLETKGFSGMGWLWWLLAAILAVVLLALALSRCGDSDGDTGVASTDQTAPAATPTPDAALLARQQTLDSILVGYPNVSGEVKGNVAVLDGTVADEVQRAELDMAVRASGLGVQNNVTADAATAAVGAEGYSMNDLIDAQPQLSTLRELLVQAGLGEALGGTGPFTLFAPTNDAFAAISGELEELKDDPDALQQVLLYHVLVGAQDSTTIAGASTLNTQLAGESISVNADGGVVTLNGTSRVIAADAEARNGIIHFVDSVLLPAEPAAQPRTC